MKINKPNPYSVMLNAYIRDGEITYSGEAMMLACLVHSKGAGRDTDDEKMVRKIMSDHNLE